MKSLCRLVVLLACISACSSGPVRRTYTNTSPTNDATRTQPTPQTLSNTATRVDLVKKAQAEYLSGNYSAALETLDSVSAPTLRPAGRTEYWNLRGLVELATHNPASAEFSFQGALGSNPNPEFAGYYQYNLASAYADEKKSADALALLNKIELSRMDSADQRKIALLKDKLARGETGSLMAQNSLGVANPTPAATPVATPVKEVYQGPVNPRRIGILLPLSGKYEEFGKKVQRAVELAFQNSPLVKNEQIELIPVDSGDSSYTHPAALKKLVEEQQVIAVIGPLLSKGVESLSERSDFYQTPLVSIAQVQGPASTYLYSCSISSEDQPQKWLATQPTFVVSNVLPF